MCWCGSKQSQSTVGPSAKDPPGRWHLESSWRPPVSSLCSNPCTVPSHRTLHIHRCPDETRNLWLSLGACQQHNVLPSLCAPRHPSCPCPHSLARGVLACRSEHVLFPAMAGKVFFHRMKGGVCRPAACACPAPPRHSAGVHHSLPSLPPSPERRPRARGRPLELAAGHREEGGLSYPRDVSWPGEFGAG